MYYYPSGAGNQTCENDRIYTHAYVENAVRTINEYKNNGLRLIVDNFSCWFWFTDYLGKLVVPAKGMNVLYKIGGEKAFRNWVNEKAIK